MDPSYSRGYGEFGIDCLGLRAGSFTLRCQVTKHWTNVRSLGTNSHSDYRVCDLNPHDLGTWTLRLRDPCKGLVKGI